jgi:hypothetical protein
LRHTIELAQLLAAGAATALFLLAGFWRVHYDLDRMVDGMKTVSRLNAVASIAGALVFACQVALFFLPP